MQLRIAAAQLPVTNNVDANTAAIRRGIDYAASECANLLLTPEGSLSGYTPAFDSEHVRDALSEITEHARAARVGLALGTCYVEDDGRIYNQLRFYSASGAYLGFHSKTLTCGTLDDPPRGEIKDYAVRPLRVFSWEGITVGGLICNDLWANPECTPGPDPHLTQQLARMGARIVLHAVNGGRNGSDNSRTLYWPYHEANLRIRARAGRLWIVTVDNCYPLAYPCSAPSGVIAPDGRWVARMPDHGEQYLVHDIELGP